MSLHVFATFLTPHGTAANNRGVTEGNSSTLQKLVWNGQVHSTVSAEAIRFALRRGLADWERCNRTYDEEERVNEWKDPKFDPEGFIDDDLLGYMSAQAATTEGKGKAQVRRAVLEVTRAVSLTPWPGDVTFNAASPGATPSAQKKGTNPVPYAVEVHATRYQYSIALTPEHLHKKDRAEKALRALCNLSRVAGNHGRFLFDFSPESVVFRITEDPAPRILYCFELDEGGIPRATLLLRKVRARDIDPSELILGGPIIDSLSAEDREVLSKGLLRDGVKAACEEACKRLSRGRA